MTPRKRRSTAEQGDPPAKGSAKGARDTGRVYAANDNAEQTAFAQHHTHSRGAAGSSSSSVSDDS
jgi:hypothetical protein